MDCIEEPLFIKIVSYIQLFEMEAASRSDCKPFGPGARIVDVALKKPKSTVVDTSGKHKRQSFPRV
jgi:hypothetical protein